MHALAICTPLPLPRSVLVEMYLKFWITECYGSVMLNKPKKNCWILIHLIVASTHMWVPLWVHVDDMNVGWASPLRRKPGDEVKRREFQMGAIFTLLLYNRPICEHKRWLLSRFDQARPSLSIKRETFHFAALWSLLMHQRCEFIQFSHTFWRVQTTGEYSI